MHSREHLRFRRYPTSPGANLPGLLAALCWRDSAARWRAPPAVSGFCSVPPSRPGFPLGLASPRGSNLPGLETLARSPAPRAESGRRARGIRKGCGHHESYIFLRSAMIIQTSRCALDKSPLPEFVSRRGGQTRTHSHDPASRGRLPT